MNLQDALQWADTFGPLQSVPPDGDGPALLTLAAEVRRLSAPRERVAGKCIEIGDDDDGQPRLVIHTTREELMRHGRNLAFAEVEVSLKTPSQP